MMPHLVSLSVDLNQLRDLDGTATASLSYLSAKHNSVTSVDGVTAAAGFGNLMQLALYRNALAGSLHHRAFQGLHLLQELNLGRNKLTHVQVCCCS